MTANGKTTVIVTLFGTPILPDFEQIIVDYEAIFAQILVRSW